MDELLSTPRTLPYNVRTCVERLRELEVQARDIIARAEAENRQPTAMEASRFDAIVESIRAWKIESRLAERLESVILSKVQPQPKSYPPLFER